MRTAILILLLAAAAAAQDRSLPLPASGSVTLPLDEYNRLVGLATNPAVKTGAPPVSYTLASAELKLQVSGEAAVGSIQMEGEILGKGVLKVPLVTGMTILDARQKGAELPLEQEAGTHVAVLNGPGDFAVTLSAGLPLSVEAGRAALNFLVPPAGAARLTLVIPGDHTNVNISPGLITGRASSNGWTTVEATLVPGRPASLWWATRDATAQAAIPREVRFLSDVKTLVSVSEADLTLTALADITVVQGDPAQFEIAVPAGYEITGVTGPTLSQSDVDSGVLVLKVASPAARSHQFLISMTKLAGTAKAEVPFLSLKGTHRETGEVLVEGEGPMELTAKEGGSLKRMDLRETSPYLRSLAHTPLQSAFRYQRHAAEAPSLALAWVRFPDSSVLAAVAQQAIVTTLVTAEGRSLTEVKLVLRNQSQPFLKVALPAGASIVSADVAGERVKPVQGADGNRVPLLRAGFHPTAFYTVSFVYLDSGAPFAKRGGSALALPKMDMPIGLLHWEVFLPQRYKVTDFAGDAIAAKLLPTGMSMDSELASATLIDGKEGYLASPPGEVNKLIGSVNETVQVTSGTAKQSDRRTGGRYDDEARDTAASSNVVNLQKRVAGVLPIPVEVPRAGTSFRFVRPLVIDEETKVTFSYKTR